MDPSLRVLIEQAEFKESFRGYDRAQVDDMLEQLATQAGKLESQLADVETRIRAEAEPEIQARVQAELEARRASGGDPAVDEERSAEEVRLTLVMAQRTADAAIKEARAKASNLVADARETADRTTADARAEASRERQKSRKELAAEVTELETVRSNLQVDIDALETYVQRQRDHLIASVDHFRELLDDPAALRTEEPPQWDPVKLPQLEQPEESEESEESEDTAHATNGPGGAVADRESGHAASAPHQQEPVPSADQSNAQRPPGETEAARAQAPTASAAEHPAAGFDAEAVVDHPAPGVIDPGIVSGVQSSGPADRLEPMASASVDVATEEDGFLAELRKAMTDDEPAGPSEAHDAGQLKQGPKWADESDHDQQARQKSRFGRRR